MTAFDATSLQSATMDVLADVLSVTRLAQRPMGHARLLPPWGVDVRLPGVAVVHIIQHGRAWLRLGRDAPPQRLEAGDVVLLPRGLAHRLSDSPQRRTRPFPAVLAEMQQRGAAGETSADDAVILCAAYEFGHDGAHPLIDVLPDCIHLRRADREADRQTDCESNRASDRLDALIGLLQAETLRPEAGSDLVRPRLLDALLVYLVRAWLQRQPAGSGGWLGALRDPLVRRALELIHQRPAEPWTVDALAAAAATSRPTLVRRFAALVGTSPGDYLAQWRLNLCAQLLRDSTLTIERIGEQVGYASAAGLSRAFSRRFGEAPMHYRRRLRGSASQDASPHVAGEG